MEVRFQGQWGGNARTEGFGLGGWRVVVVPGEWGVGETPIPKAREFPPQWPRASYLLAYLTFSQEAPRMPRITLEVGNCRKVVNNCW